MKNWDLPLVISCMNSINLLREKLVQTKQIQKHPLTTNAIIDLLTASNYTKKVLCLSLLSSDMKIREVIHTFRFYVK